MLSDCLHCLSADHTARLPQPRQLQALHSSTLSLCTDSQTGVFTEETGSNLDVYATETGCATLVMFVCEVGQACAMASAMACRALSAGVYTLYTL